MLSEPLGVPHLSTTSVKHTIEHFADIENRIGKRNGKDTILAGVTLSIGFDLEAF